MSGGRNESIHSGHFMTSKVHETDQEDEEEDEPIDVLTICDGDTKEKKQKPDNAKPVTFYKFGPKQTKSVTIDASLTKLKDTVSVSYAKLTTPKWKNFKGLRLRWQDRVRVNNVIWRAWHMEFQAQRQWRNKMCFFTMPEEDVHNRAEASVLEGMYWKRRLESICYQYKRWRMNSSSKKLRHRRPSRGGVEVGDIPDMLLPRPPQSNTPTYNLEEDDFQNVFTDRLFESLVKPFMFPNPREFGQVNNADIMQPSLLQLQPSLEDIMASLDEDYPQRDPAMGSEDNVLMQLDRGTQFESLKVVPDCGGSGPPSSGSYTSRDYLAANLLTELSSSQMSPNSAALFASATPLPGSTFGVSQGLPSLLYSQASGYEPSNTYLSPPDGFAGEPYVPQMVTASKNMGSGRVGSPLWGGPFEQVRPPPNVSLHPHSVQSPTSKGAMKVYPGMQQVKDPPSRGRGRGRGRGRPPGSLNRSTLGKQSPQMSRSLSLDAPQGLQPGGSAFSPISPTAVRAHPVPTCLYSNQQIHPSGPSTSQPLLIVQPCGSSIQMPIMATLSYPPYMSPTSSAVIKQEVDRSTNNTPTGRIEHRIQPKSIGKEHSQMRLATKRAAADSTVDPNERKRMQHLHAEQSRRSALKGGFELLEEMLPNLHTVGTKPTNAVVLQKAGEHIRELCNSLEDTIADVEQQKQAINVLNEKITSYQSHLPANSGSSSSKSALQQQYARYTREKTAENWKFWIMQKIINDLFESYRSSMDGIEGERSRVAFNDWAHSKCTLMSLRPVVSKVLVELATETNILTTPHSLKQHVKDMLNVKR